MIRWFEHRQVYVPSREFACEASALGRPFEDVNFSAGDGTLLNGWLFPSEPDSPRREIVLLLLHGNAGNISHKLDFAKAWLELGLNVFLFDYRGYGRSQGRTSEAGTYLDGQAALQWLRRRGFRDTSVVALGKSLGGGVASELALREPLGALVLQSTFSGIAEIGAELFRWLPVRRLHSIRYDTVNKLPRIHVPVLIAHSRTDTLIGFHHAERNFKAANEPKQLLEIAGTHTNVLEVGRAEYLRGLDAFIRKYVG